MKKLTTVALLWCAVLIGLLNAGVAAVDLYMLDNGAQPGTPLFLDHLAPTESEAGLQLAWGIGLMILPILLRHALRRVGRT